MTWASRSQPVRVGDTVCYSARFLRSIGCFTGSMPQARGTVTALETVGPVTLAVIDWNDEELPPKVNVANLARITQKGILDSDRG